MIIVLFAISKMKIKAYAILKDKKISIKDIYDREQVKDIKLFKGEKLVKVEIKALQDKQKKIKR